MSCFLKVQQKGSSEVAISLPVVLHTKMRYAFKIVASRYVITNSVLTLWCWRRASRGELELESHWSGDVLQTVVTQIWSLFKCLWILIRVCLRTVTKSIITDCRRHQCFLFASSIQYTVCIWCRLIKLILATLDMEPVYVTFCKDIHNAL